MFDNFALPALRLTSEQDLFTKLRFSYTEQVTKEKFLRNLVSDPPAHIDPASNYELEQSLAHLKGALQTQKAEVNALVAELEARSRALAQRHHAVEEQIAQLREIPEAAAQLRADIARMRKEQGIVSEVGEGSEELSLGLEQTVGLVEDREEQLMRLDENLRSLIEQRETKQRALKQAQDELKAAERTRDQTVRSAKEAQARRENGKGGMDDIEERGRWLRGVESTMKSLLEVES